MTGDVCALLLIFTVSLILTNRSLEIRIVKKKTLAVVNHSLAGNLRTLAGISGGTGTVGDCDYIPI